EVAPVPYPASKRPAPPATEVASAGPVGTVPAVPATGAPTTGEPLIIDEDLVERRDEAVARVLEDDQPAAVSRPRVVEGDELEEWDSGSLAEYLERKGLMSDSERADVSDPD